jgi:hypothetical protein
MAISKAATAEEASREATMINSTVDMAVASSATMAAGIFRKEEAMAVEEDTVEGMMI